MRGNHGSTSDSMHRSERNRDLAADEYNRLKEELQREPTGKDIKRNSRIANALSTHFLGVDELRELAKKRKASSL